VGGDLDGDGCKNLDEDADVDADGVADASDGCVVGETGWTSSAANDHDGDGCRDATEDADDDNDGVLDASDQCPTQANATSTGCPAAPITKPITTPIPTPAAFGTDTRVKLTVPAKRVRARGPVRVKLANANAFAVAARVAAKAGKPRAIKLGTRGVNVTGSATTTLSFRVPKAVRRAFQRKGRLVLRLNATVTDPAGNVRTVQARVTLRLKRR
jgi:hypothetical protein